LPTSDVICDVIDDVTTSCTFVHGGHNANKNNIAD